MAYILSFIVFLAVSISRCSRRYSLRTHYVLFMRRNCASNLELISFTIQILSVIIFENASNLCLNNMKLYLEFISRTGNVR